MSKIKGPPDLRDQYLLPGSLYILNFIFELVLSKISPMREWSMHLSREDTCSIWAPGSCGPFLTVFSVPWTQNYSRWVGVQWDTKQTEEFFVFGQDVSGSSWTFLSQTWNHTFLQEVLDPFSWNWYFEKLVFWYFETLIAINGYCI